MEMPKMEATDDEMMKEAYDANLVIYFITCIF